MWENRTLLSRITDRLSQLELKYNQFQISRDWIVSLFRPDIAIDTEESSRGNFLGNDIYEGTAPWAARVMATGLQGNLVSKSIDWIQYLMKQFELRGIDELDVMLQDVKDHMTDVYRRSNFYDVQPQFTLNGLTIGSPVMFGEEDIVSGTIKWMPQHYKHCFVVYNKYNEIDGIIVKDTTFTAKQIYDTFLTEKTPEGKKTEREKKFSQALNNAIDMGRMYEEFTILRAVFKKEDSIWQGDKEHQFKKPIGNQTWYDVYFEETTEKDKDQPLKSGGHFGRPFVVWDYDKKNYEACSRTPAYDAIWDTISHQQVYKNLLENMQYKNRYPKYALNSMKGRLQLSPEGITYVNDKEYDRPVKGIDVIGDIQYNEKMSAEFKENIKRHFHLDLFQLFTNVAAAHAQPLTATQIWQMAGEKSTLLSPAVETHSHYLKDVDDRMMDIEARAGRGPFNPDNMAYIAEILNSKNMKKVGSVGIIPEFIGPLARAQKVQQAMDPITQSLQASSSLFQVWPDLKFAIKEYDLLDDMLHAGNFPMKNLKTKEDYQKVIDEVNDQRAQQAKEASMLEMMKASKNIQGAVDPTSIMAGAGKAMAGSVA